MSGTSLVNQNVPPFVLNLAGILMGTAIIGLATWAISMNRTIGEVVVRAETSTETLVNRLNVQATRITALQDTLASMQVQVVKDLQIKGDEVLAKIEKSEGAREARGSTLDNRLNALVDAISKLSSQVAVVTDRVDNYIADLRNKDQVPTRR